MTRMNRHGEPDRRYGRKGPQQDRWLITDPWHRQLRYKFLRARAQAKFWNQEWQLTWEQYLEIMRSNTNHGRDMDAINLCRRDTDGAWSVANCELIPRRRVVCRQRHRYEDGRIRRRVNTLQKKKLNDSKQ